jgi:hypothetical protein
MRSASLAMPPTSQEQGDSWRFSGGPLLDNSVNIIRRVDPEPILNHPSSRARETILESDYGPVLNLG